MDKDAELIRETHVSPEVLKGIRALRLIDDTYFTCFYDNFKEGMELTLRIILNKPDIQVKEVITQRTAPNLYGRGVRFDVLARDGTGKFYNCEVQRDSREAIPRRARMNSSMLDAREVSKGTPFKELPETYVIFITEMDVFHRGRPLYTIHRTFDDSHKLFGDGTHIVYVNGENRDDTPLGKLMQDFFAEDPQKMHYPVLAERAEFFKDKPKGVSQMNEILDEIMNRRIAEATKKAAAEAAAAAAAEATKESVQKSNRETAVRLLKMGLSPEQAAEGSTLPLDEINKLRQGMSV